jgi:WD40 repeat protein
LVSQLGKGTLVDMTYSPDGKTLAVLGSGGITIFDAHSLKEQRLIEATGMRGVFYRSDGTLLAVSGPEPDGRLQFWEVGEAAAQPVSVIPCTWDCAYQVSSDGTRLATYDADSDREVVEQVNLWGIDGAVHLGTSAKSFLDFDTSFSGSQDLSRLALMFTFQGTLKVYQLKGDAYESIYAVSVQDLIPDYDSDTYPDYINMIYEGMHLPTSTSPDGKLVAVGGPDNLVRVFRVDDPAQPVITLSEQAPDPHRIVTTVQFSSDGKVLAAVQDQNLYVYRTSDWKLLARHKGEKPPLAFTPDGSTMAAYAAGLVQFSRTDSGTRWGTLQGYMAGGDVDITLSPDGRTLAVVTNDGISLWDLAEQKVGRRITLGDLTASNAQFSPDGRRIAASVAPSYQRCGSTMVWDVSSGSVLATLRDDTLECAHLGHLAFSPDGHWLAVGGAEVVQVWEMVGDGYRLRTYGPSADSQPVVVSPDAQDVAFRPSPLVFSPDSRAVVYRVSPEEVAAYTIESEALEIIQVKEARAVQTASAEAAGWLPTLGWVVFAVDSSNTILVGRQGLLETRVQLALPGNRGSGAYTFSPDMQLVAGINGDRVLVWDARTGQFLGMIPAKTAQMRNFAFSPDSSEIITLETNGLILTWRLPR